MNHPLTKGSRVRLTEKGLSQGFSGRQDVRTGVVTGFGASGYPLIRRDDVKTPCRYHPSFWELDTITETDK